MQRTIGDYIDSLPAAYRLQRRIPCTLRQSGKSMVASFRRANISTSGETRTGAMDNLKSLILDVYDMLSREPKAKLGPEPARQLQVLQKYISKE